MNLGKLHLLMLKMNHFWLEQLADPNFAFYRMMKERKADAQIYHYQDDDDCLNLGHWIHKCRPCQSSSKPLLLHSRMEVLNPTINISTLYYRVTRKKSDYFPLCIRHGHGIFQFPLKTLWSCFAGKALLMLFNCFKLWLFSSLICKNDKIDCSFHWLEMVSKKILVRIWLPVYCIYLHELMRFRQCFFLLNELHPATV